MIDDAQSQFLPDGRYRGTENLPDQGWTANLFNSRVHPNSGKFESWLTVFGLVIVVAALIAGVFGLILQSSWTGQSFLISLAAFLWVIFFNSGG